MHAMRAIYKYTCVLEKKNMSVVNVNVCAHFEAVIFSRKLAAPCKVHTCMYMYVHLKWVEHNYIDRVLCTIKFYIHSWMSKFEICEY